MNSIKNKTITLKRTENDSGPLFQNTENQQILKNDIVVQNEISSNEIESVDCGHPDTGTQLIAPLGEECKETMKENMMGDKLKDYTFSVDDKNVGTGQEASTIILTGISAAVTGSSRTVSDDELDGTVKLNTNGTDVSNDVEVTYSNVGKKMEIVENRTVDGTQETMATATKKTGFTGLFRSPVLRKYNLIMIFVW